MQIVGQENKQQSRAEQIEQFLKQNNADGFALFCWNDSNVGNTFTGCQENLRVYAASEGIFADSLGDLALMVIQRWCRRDATIREKERGQASLDGNLADTGKVFYQGGSEMKEAA